MGTNFTLATELAKTAIGAFDVPDGMRWLINRLGEAQLDPKIRTTLSKLDFAADARLIQRQIVKLLGDRKIVGTNMDLYFGLDPLNMPHGKGIEFGCGPDLRGNIRSGVFQGMFTLAAGGVAEIALGLGYLGLALKQAFCELGPDLVLQSITELRVTFGFHDGDLLELGKVTRDGFALSFEFTPPEVDTQPATPAVFPWPGEGGDRADWLYASGLIAVGIEDDLDRALKMTSAREMLCGMGRIPEAERLVQEMLRFQAGLNGAERVKVLCSWASGTIELANKITRAPSPAIPPGYDPPTPQPGRGPGGRAYIANPR